MLIDDAMFVVVDTETTGLRSGVCRIIEIAGVKAQRGKVIDQFQALINPEQPIPRHITRLTGIKAHMVECAPTARTVLTDFVAFVGDAVVVMHNARFDTSFINTELSRAGLRPLKNQTLCTVRLARRLLRGLPSKSLRSLKAFYGIDMGRAHRALEDATATFEVLMHLVARVRAEHRLRTVEELVRFQRQTYRKTGTTPKAIKALRKTVLPSVPAGPGVYFFRDQSDRLLYIGKAKNLSRRIGSYFVGIEGKNHQTRRLVHAVRRIEWTLTKTEFAAILLEHRLRKEHQPSYNRADRGAHTKRFAALPFLRIGTQAADRRVTVVRHVRDDGAEYYGPFSDRQMAQTITKAFFSVYGEQRTEDQFASLRAAHLGGRLTAHGLDEVRAFLNAPREEILSCLHEKMKAASDELAFERAAELRDWIGRLGAMRRKRFVTGTDIYDRNVVVVVPQATAVEVYMVRFGLLVDEVVAAAPPEAADKACIQQRLTQHYTTCAARPQRYAVHQSDEIRLLSLWLHQKESSATIIPWGSAADPMAFAQAVAAAMNGP